MVSLSSYQRLSLVWWKYSEKLDNMEVRGLLNHQNDKKEIAIFVIFEILFT